MSHVYRCMHCRAQNRFKKPLQKYVRVPLCKHCGSKTRHKKRSERKTDPRYYVDKQAIQRSRTMTCQCLGYHFPHRRGSKHCNHHPLSEYHQRVRAGEDASGLQSLLTDLKIEHVLKGGRFPHSRSNSEAASQCPF